MSANKLPPLPNPDIIVFGAALQSPLEGVTTAKVRAYGQQCYQQALEDAARMLMAEHERRWHIDNHALFFAHKVRSLKDKT